MLNFLFLSRAGSQSAGLAIHRTEALGPSPASRGSGTHVSSFELILKTRWIRRFCQRERGPTLCHAAPATGCNQAISPSPPGGAGQRLAIFAGNAVRRFRNHMSRFTPDLSERGTTARLTFEIGRAHV